LLALSAVSKRFQKLIRQPAVWCDLDLSSHASFLTDRLLLNIVRGDGAFSLLRSVCLGGCVRVTDAAVCKLLSACGATLEHLDLQGCTLVKTSTIQHAALACPHLVYLDLFGCTGVDTLEALRLSDDHWPKLEQLFLMETSRLSGRVPQDSFVELAQAVEARRARWQESAAAAAQQRQRLEEEGNQMAVDQGSSEVGAGATGGAGTVAAAWSTAMATAAAVDAMVDAATAGVATIPATTMQAATVAAAASAATMVAAAAAAVAGPSAGPSAMSHDALCEEAADCRCGPALKLVDLPKFVGVCRRRLDAWSDGHPVAACDHAMVMQGATGGQQGAGGHHAVLNMLPNCGHVLCVECEQKSRVNMVRRHGDTEYVYPCPLCGNDMPNPGGFEITLQ
jgi:predicted RNA-binding Zn-ribbon protein involved in translation (DUF1610 family)